MRIQAKEGRIMELQYSLTDLPYTKREVNLKEGSILMVIGSEGHFKEVKKKLAGKNITVESADLTRFSDAETIGNVLENTILFIEIGIAYPLNEFEREAAEKNQVQFQEQISSTLGRENIKRHGYLICRVKPEDFKNLLFSVERESIPAN